MSDKHSLEKRIDALSKRVEKLEKSLQSFAESKGSSQSKVVRRFSIAAILLAIPLFVYGEFSYGFVGDLFGSIAALSFWGGIVGFIVSFLLPKTGTETVAENESYDIYERETLEKEKHTSRKDVHESKDQPTVSSKHVHKESWEEKLGGNYAAKAGMLLTVIGVSFFLKWSFDNGIIGPLGRVVLGMITGMVFIGLAEYWMNKYKKYALILLGGGLALEYFSVFAARYFYPEIIPLPSTFAFIILIFITLASVFLAVKHDSEALGYFSLGGGFLTPFLINSGTENIFGMLLYILILDAGVLLLTHYKKWPIMNFVAFIATFLLSVGTFWKLDFYQGMFLLTAFYVLFTGFAVVSLLGRKEHFSPLLLSFSLLTPLFYYGQMLAFLEQHNLDNYFGLFTLILAAFYVCVGAFSFSRKKDDPRILQTFFGTSIVLISIAIFLEASGVWQVVLWAVEGAVLFYIAEKNNFKILSVLSRIVFSISLLIYFADHFSDHYDKVFLNTRVAVGALFVVISAYLFYEFPKSKISPVFIGMILLIPFFIGFAEIDEYFYLKRLAADGSDYPMIMTQSMLQDLSYSIYIILYAIIVFMVGIWKRLSALRKIALGLFVFAIAKALLYDISQLEEGYRIASFIILGLVLLGIALWYQKNRHTLFSDSP